MSELSRHGGVGVRRLTSAMSAVLSVSSPLRARSNRLRPGQAEKRLSWSPVWR